MIKLVVCDLDETLLNRDKTCPVLNIEAITKIKEMGVRFVLATGRPYFTVYNTLDELDLKAMDDVTVSYNGGMIHRNHDHAIINRMSLDKETADFLFEFGKQFDVCMHVYVETETYVYNLNDGERLHLQHFPGTVERFDEDIDFIQERPIIKMIYQNTDIPYLESIEAQLPDSIKDKLELSYSSNRYLELNPKGVSKGNALDKVVEMFGVSHDEVLAIGDNGNDISMLKLAGYSAAPSNAIKPVKDLVTYVSDKAFDEAAVSDILHKLIINQ